MDFSARRTLANRLLQKTNKVRYLRWNANANEETPERMAYQYVREPLRGDEADRLANACQTLQEKLIVWTLLDTGLRVSELCALSPDSIQWQQRQIRVYEVQP